VDPRIFLWSQRKKADADGTPPAHTVDLSFPYFVVCILAASAANTRGTGFYVGACVLAGIAWYCIRHSLPGRVWGGIVALLVAVAVGRSITGYRGVPEGVQPAGGNWYVTVVHQPAEIDTVYHLAAYAAEGLSHFIRAFNYQNNVGLPGNLPQHDQETRKGKGGHMHDTFCSRGLTWNPYRTAEHGQAAHRGCASQVRQIRERNISYC